jgi:glycosyltransferase involved in cell wall biosynthesis
VTKRLRVLALAEAANPEWVSVPLVGWSIAKALGEYAEVHLVTQVRNRDAMRRAGLKEGADFTAIDTEALERPLWKVSSTFGLGWTSKMALNAMSYPYFERLVWRRLGAEITSGEYDIVHRITPVSPTVASPIASKCAGAGVPFILGPLNGGLPWPRAFDKVRRQEREWLSYIRGVYKVFPGQKRMLESCSAILVGSHHTGNEMPRNVRERVVYIPENGIDPERFPQKPKRRIMLPIRACFLGRLVPYKGADMVIEAAAPLLADGRLTLEIVGDGPMAGDLETFASAAGVDKAITFHGWISHDAVPEVLGRADVLTFPSIREFGGGVILEAMALGTVPLVVDYGGPGELVDSATGFKIPLGTRENIIAALRSRLIDICENPQVLLWLSASAQQKALSDFTWRAKAKRILEVYNAAISPPRGG